MYHHDCIDYKRHLRSSTALLAFGFLAAVVLVIVCGDVAAADTSALAEGNAESMILAKCRADLAQRLKLKPADVKLADIENTTWPNSALGMPEIGKSYAMAKVPGSKLFLQAGGRAYLYTTGAKAFRYGGPTSIWAYSMLYTQPLPNDPNLNGDLYQASLLGTNSVRLASGVSDYYPQLDGIVAIKRRTSRSGHDLLYIKAGEPAKEKMLYQGMDFVDAALDVRHNRWAAFVRPRVGAAWTVVTGQLDQEGSKAKIMPLPEGTRPEKMAWSLDDLMILVKKGNGALAFSTNPAAEPPAWKPVSTSTFPGQMDFVLNKSESLVVEQAKDADKPTVEVARVWFNGDRNPVATISGFTMQGCSLVGPYAFIWGARGSQHGAYSVDINTGITVAGFVGDGSNIKPFYWPPHDSPVPRQPRLD